jgi:threonylcarbamoyladenosine tRNA methylthiotransferase MtaB
MKVFLDTVGCRLNQAEIEGMARQFRAAGHEIVAAAEHADLAVVNTCTVTAEAARDSRGQIRQAGRAAVARVVATGCWATVQPAMAAGLPGVTEVIPNDLKDRLVSQVLHIPEYEFEREPLARMPLPGARRRTRAFIKVQDGCDNRCTFCVTTIARGEARSRPALEVIADIEAALRGGAREIALTGVHVGSWGRDFGKNLNDLVLAILGETEAPRIRLSSLEPWDLTADFFELWRDRRLCRHFHLPLQSGCAATLRRMARKTTPEAFRTLVAAVRDIVPDAAITTDVIAGFPGETEDEFQASLDFVREMHLSGGHAFSYSPMGGTAASRMPDQVATGERRRRNAIYRQVFGEAAQAFRRRHVGQTRPVLWESVTGEVTGDWRLSGLTDNYIRVSARASTPRWNEIDSVHLEAEMGEGLHGIISKTG